jgi:hypothetical protein
MSGKALAAGISTLPAASALPLSFCRPEQALRISGSKLPEDVDIAGTALRLFAAYSLFFEKLIASPRHRTSRPGRSCNSMADAKITN